MLRLTMSNPYEEGLDEIEKFLKDRAARRLKKADEEKKRLRQEELAVFRIIGDAGWRLPNPGESDSRRGGLTHKQLTAVVDRLVKQGAVRVIAELDKAYPVLLVRDTD